MSSCNRSNEIVSTLFQLMILVEISLALAGVLCGIWGTAAGKPGAVIVLTISAVAAAAGWLFHSLYPKLLAREQGAS